MNVLFVMCEGPHDAQFVGRLLQESGKYKTFDAPLRDWPVGIREFIIGQFKAVSIDSIKVQKPLPVIAPACAFCSTDMGVMILPIPLGGMDKFGRGVKLVTDIEEAFTDQDVVSVSGTSVKRIGVLFLYDADDRGINETVALFTNQIRYGAHYRDLAMLQHGIWCSPKGYRLSIFVFSDQGTGKGTLEDSLSKIFSSKNPDLLCAAQTVTGTHFPPITAEANALAHETKKKKATLTICGQQSKENAGASLAVIVRDTDLLQGAFDFTDSESDFSKLLHIIETAFAE